MTEHVAAYASASERNDIDALMACLAPDVELVSPLSARIVFRGAGDVRHVLSAVYGLLKDLRWEEQVGDGDVRVLVGTCRILGLRLTDAMVFDLDPSDGRIARIRPHLRPWLATTAFALALGPKVAARPGAVRRSLGRPS